MEKATMREAEKCRAVFTAGTVLVAHVLGSEPVVPNLRATMKTTFPVTGSAESWVGSRRSQVTVLTPAASRVCRWAGSEKRATPVTVEDEPASRAARAARTARLTPIFPATPRMVRSPERRVKRSTSGGEGRVSVASSSATEEIMVRRVGLMCSRGMRAVDVDWIFVGLGLVASAVLGLAEPVTVRGGFAELKAKSERGEAVHVVMLGGSITENGGGHSKMVPAWLGERFPEVQVRVTNAGMSSTCSTSGAFRFGSHVLGKGAVDLLVVEFAVNDDQDAGHAKRECVRGMEGIVRQMRRANPEAGIVMVHFVNPGMLAKVKAGETPVSIGAHEEVAAHYGVTTVNVAAAVAEAELAGDFGWEEYGGTHPKEFGYRLASRLIGEAIEKGMGKPSAAAMPECLDVGCYDEVGFIGVGKAEAGEGWERGRVGREMLPLGGIRGAYEEWDLLRGVSGVVKFGFEGTAVGAFVLAGPDCGDVEVRVDGGEWEQRGVFHRFSKGLNYPRSVMFFEGLGKGRHVLELRPLDGKAVNLMWFEVNHGG